MDHLAKYVKEPIKFAIRSLCEDFSFSRVNTLDLRTLCEPNDQRVRIISVDELRTSPFEDISAHAEDNFTGGIICGVWEEGKLAGFLVSFPGNSYRDIALPRGLKSDEVLVTSMVVAAAMRNRNLGTVLYTNSLRILGQRGFRRGYGVAWHNNWASLRMNHKSGMTLDHSIIVIKFRFWPRPLYIRFSAKGPRLRKVLAPVVARGGHQS